MKRFFFFLGFLFMVAACELVDGPFDHRPRGGRNTASGAASQPDSTSAPQEPDTVVWASVVRVPEGYDWARDSAGGSFGGELLLYRNSEAVLRIPANGGTSYGGSGSGFISLNPGTHHIINGHLYSEHCSGGHCYICRDGCLLLQLDGTGFLKGLLELADGSLITLSCSPGDGSLTLRRGSEVLLRISGGSVLGGLGEARPALYKDGSHWCFAYRSGGALYSVRDGVISAVQAPSDDGIAEDVLWQGGKQLLLWRDADGHYLYEESTVGTGAADGSASGGRKISGMDADLHLIRLEGGLFAYCDAAMPNGYRRLFINLQTGKTMPFRSTDSWPHCIGDALWLVHGSSPFSLTLRETGDKTPRTVFSDMDAMVFSNECIALRGDEMLLGVSAPGMRPRLFSGLEPVGEFPFEGYVTALSVEIIPPN